MDPNNIMQWIDKYGFPILASVYLAVSLWYVSRRFLIANDALVKQGSEANERLSQLSAASTIAVQQSTIQMKDLGVALQNNTAETKGLSQKIDKLTGCQMTVNGSPNRERP